MARDLILGEVPRGWSRDTSGFDRLVWTPAAVRAELDRVRDLLDLANREVGRAVADKKVSGDEWRSWSDTYKTGHKLVDRASPLWGSNVAAARQYASEAERWRELVRQRGGRSAAPEDAGKLAPPENKWSTREVALAGAGGVVALALLVSVLKR